MLPEILNAILTESQALLNSFENPNYSSGNVILQSKFRAKNIPSYPMPLLVIGLGSAPESSQYLGGVTRMDWAWGISIFNWEPDNTNDDPTPFSTDLLLIVDLVRQHFSYGELSYDAWFTPGMYSIQNAYSFKMTLNGLHQATQIYENGNVMGWEILFESIAIDEETNYQPLSASTLENIEDNGGAIVIVPTEGCPTPIIITIMANTTVPIGADTYIPDISLLQASGAPVVRIGLTPGGTELLDDTTVTNLFTVGFNETTTQQYFAAAGNLYIGVSGGGVVVRINQITPYFGV